MHDLHLPQLLPHLLILHLLSGHPLTTSLSVTTTPLLLWMPSSSLSLHLPTVQSCCAQFSSAWHVFRFLHVSLFSLSCSSSCDSSYKLFLCLVHASSLAQPDLSKIHYQFPCQRFPFTRVFQSTTVLQPILLQHHTQQTCHVLCATFRSSPSFLFPLCRSTPVIPSTCAFPPWFLQRHAPMHQETTSSNSPHTFLHSLRVVVVLSKPEELMSNKSNRGNE